MAALRPALQRLDDDAERYSGEEVDAGIARLEQAVVERWTDCQRDRCNGIECVFVHGRNAWLRVTAIGLEPFAVKIKLSGKTSTAI